MTSPGSVEVALLAALAAGAATSRDELLTRLRDAGAVGPAPAELLDGLRERGLVTGPTSRQRLTPAGAAALLDAYVEIAAALDPSPPAPGRQECPSLPWVTSLRTEWIEALSLNYAVAPEALAPLLPAPLEPELHKGAAWVQVLMSSLRELRPRGMPASFGVCFYQVSYRAAVRYRAAGGAWRRGGFFVRSETNDPLMRAIGNRLTEFAFHDFGLAEMVMLRDGDLLTVGVDPLTEQGGRLAGVVDTTPLAGPPAGSVWADLDELQEPLVDCFDAFGVDREADWLYVLTIDRGPWKARFVRPVDLYCELFDDGPLAGDRSRLDSVLHVARCAYEWRPLRREPLPGTAPP